ncbi:hypothetical protein ANN_06569 [Periplaneta americana]|uniref:Uncharacterized protein n=1 Tax=Periplaneta americana TaxID=6978 RepID=A0ABQ8TFQ3_PERAM|nr:hypothetical protein ANN_06569 [Periplaneta americana]
MGKNEPSLNDFKISPNLLPDTLSILIQFRIYSKVQAFLQLVLHMKDRDLNRFFWSQVIRDTEGNHITTNDKINYRFAWLPFGLNCSLFLLSVTLREFAAMYTILFPQTTPLVHKNMYMMNMDDFEAERAYGAALYIYNSTSDHHVNLFCKKNRLPSVKCVTLLRLELLGAQLLRYFYKATSLDINDAVLWSDSTVTLGWIRHDANHWKTFICNQVTEI